LDLLIQDVKPGRARHCRVLSSGGSIIRSVHYPVIFCCLLLLGVSVPAAQAIVTPDFSSNVTGGTAPLAVRFWDESTSPLGWAWFFGDETYTQPWSVMNASSGWSKRYGYTSVVLPNGSIVLMGGAETVDKNFNDTWLSTDKGATWTLVNASSGWTARYGHTSVALLDGSIVLMGGYDDVGGKHDVWRSVDNGAHWTLLNSSAGWVQRGHHTSVALPDGSIVLMGMSNANDTWRSTDKGENWTLMNASSGWSERHYHTSVALPDGSIVLMGGSASAVKMNDTWRSTDQGAHWTLMNASSGWSARYGHNSVALPDNSIILMGGTDDTRSVQDVWRSTDTGMTWVRVNESAGWFFVVQSVVMPDGSIVSMGNSPDGIQKNYTCRFQPVGSSLQHPSHLYTSPGSYPVALQAFNPVEYNSTRRVDFIEVTGQTKIGVYRNGAWYLDSSGNGWWDGPVTDRKYPAFGTTGDAPVAGDWNHDWISETGVFRNGAWYLDYSGNGWWDGPVTDRKYPAFGTTGDIPVTGDWNHDKISEIGVFRNGMWYLDYNGNGWWDGPVTDIKYPAFGTTGDIPVAGKW
jgi:PKD repeat protein